MLEADRDVVLRDPSFRSFRPFNQHQGLLSQQLIPAEIRQLRRIAQSVEVEMINDGARRGVPVNESECRTRYLVGDPVPSAQRLDERCLAGAKLAGDRHD